MQSVTLQMPLTDTPYNHKTLTDTAASKPCPTAAHIGAPIQHAVSDARAGALSVLVCVGGLAGQGAGGHVGEQHCGGIFL